MIKNIKAALFDLDGTLVDSMWMWKTIDIEYLGKFGIACPEDLQSSIEGKSFSETADYFKERFHLPHTIQEIKDTWNHMAYDKYVNDVPLKPGCLDFLRYLKHKGIKMGIATSNSRELVLAVTKKHGIDIYFDSIRTACDVEKGKPSPDIYELVAKDLNVRPEDCLVFEDITPGIMAGKNAGMKTCAVWDDYSAPDTHRKKQLADYYIEDYNEILTIRQVI